MPHLSKKKSHPSKSKHFRVDKDHVRIAAVQYKQRKLTSFEEFAMYIEYFVRVVSEYQADFVLFPEAFPMQLMTMENKPISAEKAIAGVTVYTERFKQLMAEFAVKYQINIIGGSIASKLNDGIQKVCYVFLRDGSIHSQGKVHPTPDERQLYHLEGASQVNCIKTDCGLIGVLISYDIEFPELARHLVDQGAHIIFVPYCTDQSSSYLRIRYCAQARAVEDQCFVVISGNVGNLPDVHNMDVQYSQSCIFTPCDFPFARDGIAADTTPNVETIVVADVNIKTLNIARSQGSVMNLNDRRHDLYQFEWHGPKKGQRPSN